MSEPVPPASFGTLAIFSEGKNETVDIIGSGQGEIVEFNGTDAPQDVKAKRSRLESCKFLKLQLTYRQEGDRKRPRGSLSL